MVPQERAEEKKLFLVCGQCKHEEPAGERVCVYRRELKRAAEDELGKVQADVIRDPTLQRDTDIRCAGCNGTEAVMFQGAINEMDERLRLIFVCVSCGYKWEG